MAPKSDWKKNPLREVLKQDILDDIIPKGMEAIDAMHVRPEYVAMGLKVFTPRLAGMRKTLKNELQKAERWGKQNVVRCQLKDDIVNELIPFDMPAETAWRCRAIYENMDKDLFISRLKGMRDIVKAAKEKTERDDMALVHDRQYFPKQKFDLKGSPNWSEHPASFLLDVDLDDGVHLFESFTSKSLWELREEYQDFDLEVFRGHIYQNLHTRKWRAQWVDGQKEYALVPQPNYGNNDV